MYAAVEPDSAEAPNVNASPLVAGAVHVPVIVVHPAALTPAVLPIQL